MVRPRDQNAPGKIGETRPDGYTHGNMIQKSPKHQMITDIAWTSPGVESEELLYI